MAGSFPVDICGSSARDLGNWISDSGDGLSSTASPGFTATAQCPYNGPGLELFVPGGTVSYGSSAGFKVTAPT
ncbi:MAG: hypothetical protein QOD66_2048, partial [Solirubrobacteraceae bacterium]|nr:hypothetical protein [Solirubrobacteraceae bacterium]